VTFLKLTLLVLIGVVSAPPLHAGNDKTCPSQFSPDNPRVTGSAGAYGPNPDAGIPLDPPVQVKGRRSDGSKNFYYKMPLGYQLNWLPRGTKSNFDPQDFLTPWWTFWMPNKRYPEFPLGYSLMTRSHGCEQGRAAPTSEKYFVTFALSTLGQPGTRYLPEKTRPWHVRLPTDSMDFGLLSRTKYRIGKSYKTVFKPMFKNHSWYEKYYRHVDDSSVQIYFKCNNWGWYLPLIKKLISRLLNF